MPQRPCTFFQNLKIIWACLSTAIQLNNDVFLSTKVAGEKIVEIWTKFLQSDEIYYQCDESWTYINSYTNFLDKILAYFFLTTQLVT